MRSEPSWRSATLGDIVDLRSGKALPDDLRDADGHYPVMGANGEYGRSVRPLEEVPIITIGRVGASYGAVHRTHGPAWVGDNALIARPSSDSDFLFAYYLLKTCDFRAVVSGSSRATSHSARDCLNPSRNTTAAAAGPHRDRARCARQQDRQ